MAESIQAKEDELCCSICMDIFREAESLPCHHRFCRECLRLFLEKSKPNEAEEKASPPGSNSHPQQINCPKCRAPTVLTHGDVKALSMSKELKEKDELTKMQPDIKAKGDTPMCSKCEDAGASAATTFCSNCDVFFCHDCLASLHPMRESFKRHTIIPVSELLAQKVTDGHGITDKTVGSKPRPVCDKHSQPLSIYCVTCKTVICPSCLSEHPEHSSLDIETASGRNKETFVDKTGHLTNLITETKDALSVFEQLQRDIKMNEDIHTTEIQRAYTIALNVLDSWKKTSLEAVRKRHSIWGLECAVFKNEIEIHLRRMQSIHKPCQKLLSCSEVEFLQGSKQLMERIDDLSKGIEDCRRAYREAKQKLDECVKADPVIPRDVIVKEGPTCAKPDLTFIETSNSLLSITKNGSMIECGDLSGSQWDVAFTDGHLQTGRHYWEVEISVSTSSPDSDCHCHIGVTQESGCPTARPTTNSYCVVMGNYNDKVWFYSIYGDVTPAYTKELPPTGPQHLGLFLNCEDKSLTVVDRRENQIMFTASGLNLSEPLVPFVQFTSVKSASARLIVVGFGRVDIVVVGLGIVVTVGLRTVVVVGLGFEVAVRLRIVVAVGLRIVVVVGLGIVVAVGLRIVVVVGLGIVVAVGLRIVVVVGLGIVVVVGLVIVLAVGLGIIVVVELRIVVVVGLVIVVVVGLVIVVVVGQGIVVVV
ncbi:tripartite motif-containing protein 64-like [Liolophura sinensis]|uniref:tripartite motif-containing protein 64-like n=1 Tax=Liolophura sinensis TaxID=3198878 RepID=UPI0031584AA8